MKRMIFAAMTFLLLGTAAAQQTPDPQGYWVVENNIKTPKESVIYFYTPDHQLMYKESFSGKKIRTSQPRVVKKLNAALQEVSLSWNKSKEQNALKAVVASRL